MAPEAAAAADSLVFLIKNSEVAGEGNSFADIEDGQRGGGEP